MRTQSDLTGQGVGGGNISNYRTRTNETALVREEVIDVEF